MPRYLGDDMACGSYRPGQAAPNQANAPELTGTYSETYAYDPAGNLRALAFVGAQSWTREYAVAGTARDAWAQAGNNQVTAMSVGQASLSFAYDASGNQIQQNSNRMLAWDHANRLIGFKDQASGSVSVEARYLYGADGQRVKKWVKKSGAPAESTVYIDGVFEQHQWTEAGSVKENARLHVRDGRQRVALVRRGEPQAEDAGPAIQYVLSDHLMSSQVVADAAGSWVNREEYFAYGETSFGGFAKKRYRFTGKERDEESGLGYYGARYYVPWLCRWTSTDPAGRSEGLNLYVYAYDNPVRWMDSNGRENEACNPEIQSCPETNGNQSTSVTPTLGLTATAKPNPTNVVVRKVDPEIYADPTEFGFSATSPGTKLSPAEHVLNEHAGGPTPYISASRREGGAPGIEGDPYYIDMDAAGAQGVREISTGELLKDVDRYVAAEADPVKRAALQTRAAAYHQAQNPANPNHEAEVLLTGGDVPAAAVQTATGRVLRNVAVGASGTLHAVSGGLTVYSGVQMTNETGNPAWAATGTTIGVTEATGGSMYVAGALGGSAEAAGLGAMVAGVGALAGILFADVILGYHDEQMKQSDPVYKQICEDAKPALIWANPFIYEY